MQTQQTKKTGRPIVVAREGEKATCGFRATPDLKRDLVAAAERNGASFSEECVSRLKFSLTYETAFGHRELFHLASQTLGAFRHAGRGEAARLGRRGLLQGEAWLQNSDCYDNGMRVAIVEFALARPGGLDLAAFDRIASQVRGYIEDQLRLLDDAPPKAKRRAGDMA
jgi:hypothetical protein